MKQQLDSQVLSLCKALIACRSITPQDAGCQDIIAKRLTMLGFEIETWTIEGVKNLWAKRPGNGPLFAFSGHTDVVPPGPEKAWRSPPFELTTDAGKHTGRGIADMKGGIAAMLIALEHWLGQHPNFADASLGFMLTSDEEGPSLHGTRAIMEKLTARGEKIDYCIVGEPSSSEAVGDTVRIGRRGSLHMHLTLHGKQGHIAYPHLAANPIHLAAPLIQTLSEHIWDDGYDSFPPTSFQFSSIRAGESSNVIPGAVELRGNFRYCPASSVAALEQATGDILANYPLRYDIEWDCAAKPFYSSPGPLTHAIQQAIMLTTGRETTLSTAGGTSDGRFIAPTGAEVVELGLTNATIHHINEHIAAGELGELAQIYLAVLNQLLT